MNIYDVLRVLMVLVCLGGIWSVADSVKPVDAESSWDGCVSDGLDSEKVCYMTWQVGEFDLGVPLVVKRYRGLNGSDSFEYGMLVEIFRSECFLFE